MPHRPPREILLVALSLLLISPSLSSEPAGPSPGPAAVVKDENQRCVDCHERETPGIVAQWRGSAHARQGVACRDCHGADAKDPGAFLHEGATIVTIVTPANCANCHGDIAAEFQHSHHAGAAKFIGSLDNVLGEVVEGRLAAANGCWQCHGSTVTLLRNADGSIRKTASGAPAIDPNTWPNTGIGRVNLDGTLGACTACHSRHAFSKAMARQPEVCGKCHLGPDHPQAEIYAESKHGIAYRTEIEQMHLDSASWVLGVDYSAAPTCSTCHMSATRGQKATHDVGARISWTLRPVVSKKLEHWEEKRAAMKEVCSHCHGGDFIDAFYRNFDATVDLWNTKFAEPAQKIMEALKKAGKITPTPFDDEIEWTFYRLWHHEGRRARMGASMQGPDFVQWHGFFEVAENFYTRFIPQAREAARGDESVLSVIRSALEAAPHAWLKGFSPEERAKIDAFYRERYEHP